LSDAVGATSGKLRRKNSVFSRRLKAGKELAEMTPLERERERERTFLTREAATGNWKSTIAITYRPMLGE